MWPLRSFTQTILRDFQQYTVIEVLKIEFYEVEEIGDPVDSIL
jgi:hypothetical protein